MMEVLQQKVLQVVVQKVQTIHPIPMQQLHRKIIVHQIVTQNQIHQTTAPRW